MVRLPMPASWRKILRQGVKRGWCQWAIAVLAGALAGGAVGLAAVASGWVLVRAALLLGAVVFGFVVVTLLVARHRAVPPGDAPPA
jgi:hypothetical protein